MRMHITYINSKNHQNSRRFISIFVWICNFDFFQVFEFCITIEKEPSRTHWFIGKKFPIHIYRKSVSILCKYLMIEPPWFSFTNIPLSKKYGPIYVNSMYNDFHLVWCMFNGWKQKQLKVYLTFSAGFDSLLDVCK